MDIQSEHTCAGSSSCAERPWRSVAFVITPYVPGPDGRLRAKIPACCPIRMKTGQTGCRLVVVHHRFRKTGPRHPLTAVRCRTHRCTFTLYPPGYAPYRRQSLVDVAPDGSEIYGDRKAGLHETRLSDTLFQVALDAKSGHEESRQSSEALPQKPNGTQRRHLCLAARIVGVARDLSERVRSSIAAVLSVDHLRLHEGSRATGQRMLAKAVYGVLAVLIGQKFAVRWAMELLTCGHLIGYWGEPLHWDAQRRVMERSPYVAAEMAPSRGVP